MGEAPYENENADGLAFSVPDQILVPPSLWIIFSEICHDLHIDVQHTNGNLVRWAQQGVLLLNSKLTIGRRRKWGYFTQFVLRKISEQNDDGIVFMLWGEKAQDRGEYIVNDEHLVLRSSHPSPQSAFNMADPFVGCRHFSKANEWLVERGKPPVNWS